MTSEEQAAQAAAAEAQAAQAAAAATAAAAAAEAAKKQEGTTHTDDPKVLRAELERARKEAAKYRTDARTAAEEKRKAEEAALADQGKHKELAETRAKALEEKEKELSDLRAFRAEREQRDAEERQRREAQVAADFATLPAEIQADVPADDIRAKEIAVRTYQRTKGTAAPARPTTAAGAPPAPPQAAGQKPAFPKAELERLAYLGKKPAPDRAAAEAKVAAWKQWIKEHPEDAR